VLVQRITYGTTTRRHCGGSESFNVKTKTNFIAVGLAWLGVVARCASAASENTTPFIPALAVPKIEARPRIVFHNGQSSEGQFLLAPGGASPSSSDGTCALPRTVNLPTHCRSLARGNGVLAAIDCRGQVRTSIDGANWIRRDAGIPFALHSVAFGNARFVAVGNEGAIVTSEDGVTWTSRHAGTDERLRGVAWADGLFVVVGYAGTILTSKDGSRWIQRESGTSKRLQAVTHGNGTFVTVGWNGVILTSAKGTRWSKQSSGTGTHLHSIVCTSNIFVVLGDAGKVLVSTNGTNWSAGFAEELSERRCDPGNRSGCDQAGIAKAVLSDISRPICFRSGRERENARFGNSRATIRE
jgi:hypothetical protein